MKIKKKKQTKGINMTISEQAHAKIRDDAYKATPRRSLRQQVNFITKLDIDL